VDPDDLLQLWSYCDGVIERLVAADFTICLKNDEYAESETLEARSQSHVPGDFRRHYMSAGGCWKRVA